MFWKMEIKPNIENLIISYFYRQQFQEKIYGKIQEKMLFGSFLIFFAPWDCQRFEV